MYLRVLLLLLFSSCCFFCGAQSPPDRNVRILDVQHYSHVFAEMRNYRVFLPPGYHENTDKKYPVIYFMHGWSQRFFGSGPDAYSEYDQGEDNNGDNIEKFVSAHEVIVIKSDGYNRGKDEDYYLRPYNVGPVETHRQFPVYFEELIRHVDGEYRTQPDRSHRAISGLSMGGFMSFFIAGKYPHFFSAAGSFCGSPEFVIGPKEMPVEYRHMDLYRNYDGMNVRLHYGDQDFIRGYHEDLNRVWSNTMENYSCKIFPGDEHTTSGLGEMFEFLFNTFKDPPAKPAKWSHRDIYPAFTVWNYEVNSDRNISGFSTLENVDSQGFKISVREFLPDGPTMPYVNISVLTDTIYKINTAYIITDYSEEKDSLSTKSIMSDNAGRLKIRLDGGVHHVGISSNPEPNITLLAAMIKDAPWAVSKRDLPLSLTLLNKGFVESGPLQIKISAAASAATFSQSETTCVSLDAGQSQECSIPVVFRVEDEGVDKIRLKLNISNGNSTWTEDFAIEIKPEVGVIGDYQLADGGIFVVVKGGDEIDTLVVGKGNADGIANPGEQVEILVKDQEVFRRTLVTSKNSCINPKGMNIRHSDYWGRYDHVGGSAKYSVLTIGSECNSPEAIPLFIEYWLPERPLHIIKNGTINLSIQGEDETPPQLSWATMTGKNLLQVKVIDGSPVKLVTGTFLAKNKASFIVTLNDEGQAGDWVKSDGVFSVICPPQSFDFYQLTLELEDVHGNKSKKEISEPFILHH